MLERSSMPNHSRVCMPIKEAMRPNQSRAAAWQADTSQVALWEIKESWRQTPDTWMIHFAHFYFERDLRLGRWHCLHLNAGCLGLNCKGVRRPCGRALS